MNRDDDDRWIERTVSDPEFADAVWSGRAPADEAPAWYPRLARMLRTACDQPEPDDADLARRHDAWSEVVRQAQRRQRLRRVLTAGAVAVGVALAAGSAAAAMGGVESLPFLGSETGEGGAARTAGPADVGGGDGAGVNPTTPAVASGTEPDGHARCRPEEATLPTLPDAASSPGCYERRRPGGLRKLARSRSGAQVRPTPGAQGRPADLPAGPTHAPGRPVDLPAGPVGPSAGPVDPSVDPAAPSAGPVDPATHPADPSAGPADPSSGPADAGGPAGPPAGHAAPPPAG